MISCPGCGSNPRFDIATQLLLCPNCGSYYDPATFPEEETGASTATVTGDYVGRPDEMQVTIYTCSQCGGELMSTDTDATAFCSYCGSHQILEERIAMHKRPQHIIPFKITKDDCKKVYGDKMRRHIFAPKELRDPAYIDEFRGIYMPYWMYNFRQQGTIKVDGTKEHRSGDYRIVEHYDLTMEADNHYNGISHDASLAFEDSISESMAPFDTRAAIPFRTPYISGFYADISDVPREQYRQETAAIAAKDAYETAADSFKGYSTETPNVVQLIARTHTSMESASNAFFPVWFLSYRNGDRVAYAAINGQTGKMSADIPIDKKKYFIGVAVLTVLIWVILQLFNISSLRGITMYAMTAAFFGGLIYYMVISKLVADTKMRDWEEAMRNASGSKPEAEAAETAETAEAEAAGSQAETGKDKKKKKSKKDKKLTKPTDKGAGIWGVLAAFAITVAAVGIAHFVGYGFLMLIVPPVLLWINLANIDQARVKRGKASNIALAVALELSAIIWLINPWYDTLYYVSSLILTGIVVWCFFDVLYYHNQIMTRPLPQFNKQGGDDRA